MTSLHNASLASESVDRKRHEDMSIKRVEPPTKFDRIACPCCAQRVETPTLDIVIDHYDIPPQQACILAAVWKGKGMPVPTERIFDSMYADDPDGGPSPAAMYRDFKVALCRLRKRLEGSGVTVETVGYREGYRLALGNAALRAEEVNLRTGRRMSAARRTKSSQQIEVVNATCS
ncbi:helix-turn-helix domain-containing protein [Sinorhizobium meliloti]|uniref:helix-turn-helix domain-containing protein n=1 Tax=Rhizobium meliloti TaxID=382 RepID=UPI0019147CB3|nr:helix-turn-helix domain-containing protein [Sinorhizobium meliloti]